MTRFEATNHSVAAVAAERARIWEVLSDPDLLAQLTPLVRRIEADGDTWVWHMAGIEVLGIEVAPVFTEDMDLTPQERIDFAHDPPAGARERGGADGHYLLSDDETAEDPATRLEIRIAIHVDLPLPKLSRTAVEMVMEQSMARTGAAFARNLLRHLGIR